MIYSSTEDFFFESLTRFGSSWKCAYCDSLSTIMENVDSTQVLTGIMYSSCQVTRVNFAIRALRCLNQTCRKNNIDAMANEKNIENFPEPLTIPGGKSYKK